MYFRRGFLCGVPVAVCGLLAGVGPAASADLGPEPPRQQLAEPVAPPSQWQFGFTPYGWMLNVNGNATARGHTVDINANFFQIIEKSDSLMALMGYFEARKGPLALFTDVVWADLGFPGHFEAQRNPIANLNVTVKANAQLGYQSTIIQSGVAYEIAKWPGGGSSYSGGTAGPTPYTALDVLGGARYWNQQVDLSLNITGTADFQSLGLERSRSLAIARAGTLEWVDPVVGARLRHQMASGSQLSLEGDVGGFGVGSDFSWQVVGTYGFDATLFGTTFHNVVGYRALAVDFSETGAHGRNGFDFVQHGPVLGVSFRW
jgi:hypothetical protein